ncbi:EAL domain-containing protein, partial [bacterium]|nr:EAL domain-containing protein [bacterium]
MEKKRARQLKKIIEEKRIRTLFQPIVSLKDQHIIGYEALSRGPAGMAMERPALLFEVAKVNNMSLKLENLCYRQAIKYARGLPKGMKLFINIEASVLNKRLYNSMGYLTESSLEPKDIVLEITERNEITDIKKFRKNMRLFQKRGFCFALDDTGTGYNSIRVFWELEPEYFKLPSFLIWDMDKDPLKREFIRVLINCAKKAKAKTIAEAVERKGVLKILYKLGVDYAQG